MTFVGGWLFARSANSWGPIKGKASAIVPHSQQKLPSGWLLRAPSSVEIVWFWNHRCSCGGWRKSGCEVTQISLAHLRRTVLCYGIATRAEPQASLRCCQPASGMVRSNINCQESLSKGCPDPTQSAVTHPMPQSGFEGWDGSFELASLAPPPKAQTSGKDAIWFTSSYLGPCLQADSHARAESNRERWDAPTRRPRPIRQT